MTDRLATLPDAAFGELASELGLAIGRDVRANALYEEYIARLPREVDPSSLLLSLAGCTEATKRLADLYYLIRALAPHEAQVRALFDQLHRQLDRGPSAAA